MPAACVATSALRSSGMICAKTEDNSGPVAPTIMVRSAVAALPTASPIRPSRSKPGIFPQVMIRMNPPSTSFKSASGSCTTTKAPATAPTSDPIRKGTKMSCRMNGR